MNISDIKIGTKLELELLDNRGQKIGQTFVSQLVDVIDSKNIAISAPIHQSKLLLVSNGTKLKILFSHEKLGLVYFYGTITKKDKTENLILFYINIDSNFESIQRRKYFRLDCLLIAEYAVLPANTENDKDKHDSLENNDEIVYKQAITKNISGSGACIVVDEDIPKGSIIEAKIRLSPENTITAKFKVLRNSPIEVNKSKRHALGLFTTQISVKVQDDVIKYIFEQQRLKLKNHILEN